MNRITGYARIMLVSIFLCFYGCKTFPLPTTTPVTINRQTQPIPSNTVTNTRNTVTAQSTPSSRITSTDQPILTNTRENQTTPTGTSTLIVEYLDIYEDVDPSGHTVLFWHHFTRDREETIQEIVNDFNETNLWGITVVAENQGYQNVIFKKLWDVLQTPHTPNLVLLYQNQAATFQLSDSLVNIDSLMTSIPWGLSEVEKKDFFPDMLSQDVSTVFENARLGFPLFRSMEMLYYNQDWLSELGYDHPPSNPSEFKEMACKAIQQPFSKGSSLESMGYEISVDASRLASWTFAFGGNLFDEETAQYSFCSSAAESAMGFLQNLVDQGCARKVYEAYADQKHFGNGDLLFSVGTSAGIPYYDQAVKNGSKFNWNIAALPHEMEKPVQNIYGVSLSIPKATMEEELAAWIFIKHLTSPEMQAKWVKVSGYYPVRRSTEEYLNDYFQENDVYRLGWEFLEYGAYEPCVPGYDIVRDIASEAFTSILNGNNITIVLENLNDKANTILLEQMTLDLQNEYVEP